jgi:hypothetical protein
MLDHRKSRKAENRGLNSDQTQLITTWWSGRYSGTLDRTIEKTKLGWRQKLLGSHINSFWDNKL